METVVVETDEHGSDRATQVTEKRIERRECLAEALSRALQAQFGQCADGTVKLPGGKTNPFRIYGTELSYQLTMTQDCLCFQVREWDKTSWLRTHINPFNLFGGPAYHRTYTERACSLEQLTAFFVSPAEIEQVNGIYAEVVKLW